MRNVWFKWRTRDTCESIVATVSFAEGIVRANGAGDRVVEIRLQELRSSSLTRGREWLQVALKKFPHWSFAKWQVLGMLAVDRTRSGSRLESCALDCWKSWHPQRRSGVAEKGYDES